MAQQVEISRETYNQNIHALINRVLPFDATGPLFQPRGEGALPAIRQIRDTDRWKSYLPFHTFPVAEATIVDGTIDRIYLDNYMAKYPHDGIVVHGTSSDYQVFTNQLFEKGQSISTSMHITASNDPLDELMIYHADSTHKSEIEVDEAVYIDLSISGIYKTTEIPFLQGKDEVTGFAYDLTKEKWYVNRKESEREELTSDQLVILRNNGFTIPASVRKNEVGLSVETNLDGRDVILTVPSGMPTQDIFKSFAHGEPLEPFSVRVDGEERVSQVYGDKTQKWHDQISKIAISKVDMDERLIVSRENMDGRCETSIKAEGLFAHNQVTLKYVQEEGEKKESYRLNQVYQWLVERDEKGILGVNYLGLNVVENYNIIDDGKISSDVYLESDKGFAFRLRSEKYKGGTNFHHSFYMQLSEENMKNLRINDKIASFAGNSEANTADHFIVEMTKAHSFELRKYLNFENTGEYETYAIDNDVLKEVFGFEIDPRCISIEGPIAHVELTMRGNRYSVTVPSSFKEVDPENDLFNGGSLIPLSLFTNAEGGWRDVMTAGGSYGGGNL